MKIRHILAAIFLIFFLWIYFFYPRELKIYAEYELYSKRETHGKFWNIIRNDDVRQALANKLGIEIPSVDFKKKYLLLSDGRRVKKIVCKRISKHSWEYDVPKGEEVFDSKHNPHAIYLYKINRVMLKQYLE